MFAELPMTFQAEISLAQNKHVLEKVRIIFIHMRKKLQCLYGYFVCLNLDYFMYIWMIYYEFIFIFKAPLFQRIPLECLRMITVAIQPVSYLPKQIIFLKNDIKHTLFYIKKGSLEVSKTKVVFYIYKYLFVPSLLVVILDFIALHNSVFIKLCVLVG